MEDKKLELEEKTGENVHETLEPEKKEDVVEESGNIRESSTEEVKFEVEDEIVVVTHKPQPKNAKLPIIIAVCVFVVAVAMAAIMFFVGNDKITSNEKGTEEPATIVSEQTTLSQDSNSSYFDENYIDEILSIGYIDVGEDETVIVNKDNIYQIMNEIKNNQQQNVNNATTEKAELPSAVQPNEIESISQSQNNENEINQEDYDKSMQMIEAYFNRTYYIKGVMYTSGVGDTVTMAFSGDDFEVLTSFSGTDVSIMKLDGKVYVKRPLTKQYVEFSDSVMSLIGLDPDTLVINFGDASFATMKDKLVSASNVMINGEQGLCFEYKSEATVYKIYTVNGNIKQVETFDEAGELSTMFVYEYFSTSIPGDKLNLKGYSKAGIFEIFADVM